MLTYNNKTYIVSEDIQYKRNKEKNSEPEYVIYRDNHTYHINGLAAFLFDRLLRFEQYGLFDKLENFADPAGTSSNNKHMVNMVFLSFLGSKWIKESNQSGQTELDISPYTYCSVVSGNHYFINFLYNTIDLIPQQVYEQVLQKEFQLIRPDDLFYLYARRYIKDVQIKETACFASNPKADQIVYLVFSYACNLRCTYCFEMGKNRALRMDEPTLDNALEYIERLSGESKILLTFYGGEPLLDMNSEKLKKVIERFFGNEKIRFRFITNGVNAHKFLDLFSLVKEKIGKFVITIDGTREVHNKLRFFGDLKGSFDEIMNNITLLSSLGYPVSIRLNVDYSNYNSQEELLLFLNDIFINKENVAIEYHRVEDKNNPHFIPVTYLDCYKLYQNAKMISKLKVKFSVPLLVALENIKEHENGFADLCNTCCSINRNHVIDMNGMVYSCNEAMGIQDFVIADVRKETVSESKIEKNFCTCPFFFACLCNCTLMKYYDNLKSEKESCEYNQIEEVIQYFLDNFL